MTKYLRWTEHDVICGYKESKKKEEKKTTTVGWMEQPKKAFSNKSLSFTFFVHGKLSHVWKVLCLCSRKSYIFREFSSFFKLLKERCFLKRNFKFSYKWWRDVVLTKINSKIIFVLYCCCFSLWLGVDLWIIFL